MISEMLSAMLCSSSTTMIFETMGYPCPTDSGVAYQM
jgi:hypothetical protein